MHGRVFALLLALYITLDFGSASLPGAFAFDPDESVEAVSAAADAAQAVVPPLAQPTTGWRGDDLLENVPMPRPFAPPRVPPTVARSVCARPPCFDPSSPADDH